MTLLGYDHVQLLVPPGGVDAARTFWVDVVGVREVEPHPASGAELWARVGSAGLHVAVEPEHVPTTRAHPAIQVSDVAEFELLAARLDAAGCPVAVPAVAVAERRMKTWDPAGNCIEFVVGTTG